MKQIKKKNDKNIASILEGKSKKFLLIIGPCSADRKDSVLDYMRRLRVVQEKVSSKIIIVPRLYTSKPRTHGNGYKGMLHNPDPTGPSDLIR
ncbi:MAG: 3-deoxy-7-phosphoheptulonate synthase, partial [Eubacteriales bacterium]|nr:3-deoxy-7-phosphoheptulonate synthase [Eubacteriales bacterium]